MAVVSDDRTKRRELGKRYRLDHTFTTINSRSVFLASTPCISPCPIHARGVHDRAAKAGVHVLCEKPMAVTERGVPADDWRVPQAGVKLMIAYRLHFEALNLAAMDLARRGQLGEPKCSHSSSR